MELLATIFWEPIQQQNLKYFYPPKWFIKAELFEYIWMSDVKPIIPLFHTVIYIHTLISLPAWTSMTFNFINTSISAHHFIFYMAYISLGLADWEHSICEEQIQLLPSNKGLTDNSLPQTILIGLSSNLGQQILKSCINQSLHRQVQLKTGTNVLMMKLELFWFKNMDDKISIHLSSPWNQLLASDIL